MSFKGPERALQLLKTLPRVGLGNIRDNPGSKANKTRGRGQHGGDKHGSGNKGQPRNHIRLGYETGNNPFYLRFGYENYYKGHHLRRQYPPLTLQQLQMMIDTDRIDKNQPIDLVTICQTGLYSLYPDQRQFGINLTEEGANNFKAKINIEVQYASDLVIGTIEKNGGWITTSYYDPHSLQAMINPEKFFQRGVPIPRRMIPPPNAIEQYTSAERRGYLADLSKIMEERFVLAQKFGYILPKIENDIDFEMLTKRKDPRQIFYDLEPGWVINLLDKTILKPTDEELINYYAT